MGQFEPVALNECWIDKYEVTNKQFKEFVDGGGYEKQEYWKEPFLKDGKALAWAEAMKGFVDRTGHPGPAAWELGTFPEGQENYPVSGVSWYEAAACAEFQGKTLPTVYRWFFASSFFDLISYIIPLSNIPGKGPAPVGSFQGMTRYGLYDMAGNVKEWCWNANGRERFILGGGWNDAAYMVAVPFSKSPFDRGPDNGFRCAREVAPDAGASKAREPVPLVDRDYDREKPVPDQIFEVYRGLYAYDKTDLAAKVERRDESAGNWIREKITFNAAYDGQRMAGYLFLPKKGHPPFESAYSRRAAGRSSSPRAKTSGPGSWIFSWSTAGPSSVPYSCRPSRDRMSFSSNNFDRNSWKDHCLRWSRDLGRSIDYLETRAEIDKNRLAYYGYSQGSIIGPILLAVGRGSRPRSSRPAGFCREAIAGCSPRKPTR